MEKRLFYLTTIPGLESVAHLELCDKWARASDFFNIPIYPEVKILKGGLEFSAPLALGCMLTQYLRIPNRILLREKSFLADNEKSFLTGLESIAWEDYFSQKDSFDFQFTSKSSKLSMKKQIQKSLEKILKPKGIKFKKGSTTIFVRIFRDQCNISLDCTGELAFKRGSNKSGSIASLRESTAAGLLRVLFQGIQSPFCLIDPMCGSGTFLTEALQINQKLKRNFQFEKFPAYKKQLEERGGSITLPPCHYPTPKKAIGLDIHEKAVELAKKNGSHFKPQKYQIHQQDLFQKGSGIFSHCDAAKSEDLKKVVVLNPPWGKRLPASSQDLLKQVVEKYDPDRIGLLMPAHWKIQSLELEKTRDLPILNSGVENRFLVFAR